MQRLQQTLCLDQKGEGRCYNRFLFSCSVLGRLGSDPGWVLEDLSYAEHGINNSHSSGAIISHHAHPPRISRSAETATAWMPLAKPLPKQRTHVYICAKPCPRLAGRQVGAAMPACEGKLDWLCYRAVASGKGVETSSLLVSQRDCGIFILGGIQDSTGHGPE